MARKLSFNMQHVLLIMNAGEKIRRTGNRDKWHPNSEDWGERVPGPTVRALLRRELIEAHAPVTIWGIPANGCDARYRLTPKGKRTVEEEWEEWLLD